MKFAICNETFENWPLERACEFAASCGYTGLEIAPFTLKTTQLTDPNEISAHERLQIRKTIEAAGLETVGLHWLLAKTSGLHLTSLDAATRRRTAEYLAGLAQLCHDLGGSIMVFGSPLQRNLADGMTREEGNDLAVDVFASILPRLEETGVTIALEPLGPVEGNYLNTAAEAVELIERLGSAHYRLHLDCKAMTSELTPIPELIHRYHQVLAHFHANDPNRQGPGFGELDFLPILAALGEVDYHGWVSVEVFDYSPGVERLAEESIANLRDYLETLAGGT